MALLLTSIATFLWAAYSYMERALLEAGSTRAQSAAEQLVGLLGPSAQQRATDLKRVARDVAIRDFLIDPIGDKRPAAEARLRSLVSSGRQVIDLWSASGTHMVSLSIPPEAASAFPPSTPPLGESLRLARLGDGPVVADVAESVMADGAETTRPPLGYVVIRKPVATASPDTLNKLLGGGGQIHLGGGRGQWTDMVALIRPSSPEEALTLGVSTHQAAQGDRRVSAISQIRGTPWYVSIEYPEAIFLAPARRFLYRTSLIAALLALVAGAVTRVITGRITRPLAELTSASGAIAAGDLAQRVDASRTDELGQLGAAFNSMITQVQDAHHDLESARDVAVRHAAQAAFVANVATATTEGADLRSILQCCTDAMVEHLDAAVAHIWTTAQDEPTLELQAASGLPSGADSRLKRVAFGTFAAGKIAATRRRVVDNSVDPAAYDVVEGGAAEFRSYAGLPLLIGDRLVGVMSMFARTPITETTVMALESVSRTVSLGIERRRLDDMRSRFEDLLESATDFVTIGRLSGPPLYINRAARAALGIGPVERVPSLSTFRTEDFQDFFEKTLLHTAQRDGIWKGRSDYVARDGRIIPVSQVSFVHRDLTGQIQYLSTIARDISDELKTAQAKANLEEQMHRAQKMEAIGQVAGGLAHDFNNLLTIILGYANVLGDQFALDDPRRADIEQIRRAGDRASQLTRQLLAFSRKQILNPVLLDLNDLIRDMEPMLGRLLGESVDLALDCDADLSAITFDPTQIELILVNLVLNARDAMPHGGRLTVETANADLDEEFCRTHLSVQPGKYIRLSVTDTGVGIDEQTRQRIFEPFFTTKGRDKGTGLGLATVFGIVKQGGGSVWVYSEPGLGASFKIFLPATVGVRASTPYRVQTRTPRGSETVLVVEDETGVRVLVETVLKRAGYTVVSTGHPLEAIHLATQSDRPIDLLLTDVVMPDLNGATLAQQLTTSLPNLRVLFMSGFADDAIKSHGVATGTAFLQKPFTGSDLALKVRQVLDCPMPVAPSAPNQ